MINILTTQRNWYADAFTVAVLIVATDLIRFMMATRCMRRRQIKHGGEAAATKATGLVDGFDPQRHRRALGAFAVVITVIALLMQVNDRLLPSYGTKTS